MRHSHGQAVPGEDCEVVVVPGEDCEVVVVRKVPGEGSLFHCPSCDGACLAEHS